MGRAVQIAWAAGLFEGEGCISLRGHGAYRYGRLSMNSTDEDVLRRFREVVGVGTVTGPYARPRRKPYWQWQAGKVVEFEHVMGLFEPHLGERRLAKAKEVLAAQTPPVMVGRGRRRATEVAPC